MPKRSSSSPAGKSVLAIFLLAALGGGVLAAYVKLTPAALHVERPDQSAGPDVSVRAHPDNSTQITGRQNGSTLLVPTVDQDDVKLTKPAGDTPEGVRPEVFLVNQTLDSLKVDGAKAVGIDVKDRVAIVSFNPGIQKGYGTIEEGHLIKALSMALGQFPEIDAFQVAVEGKTVDSLGNIDLTTPVLVIRPAQTQPTGDNGSSVSHP